MLLSRKPFKLYTINLVQSLLVQFYLSYLCLLIHFSFTLHCFSFLVFLLTKGVTGYTEIFLNQKLRDLAPYKPPRVHSVHGGGVLGTAPAARRRVFSARAAGVTCRAGWVTCEE